VLTPEQTVDGINRRFGRHAGARALHAKGTVLKGSFTATPEAGRLTRAAHMQGEPVDVTVRFSNGSGDPRSNDYEPDVRGMATTFHLPGGSRTDISAQTVPHFPVKTQDAFVELVLASVPGVKALYRFPLFLLKHPKALRTLKQNAPGLKPPASFASRRYFAIHAFRWTNADGEERFVRYTWQPEAKDAGISVKEARSRGSDYLIDEIRERVQREPVRFTLELQLAAEGDDPADPTHDWSSEERATAGTLELTGLADEGDEFVYDPTRLTDGIAPSDDPILLFRPRAYSVSAERRLG
jgi:catalase